MGVVSCSDNPHLVSGALDVESTGPLTSVVFGDIPFPEDNEITDARVELGKQLFFDKRLSSDSTVSCSSCHLPEQAFTDNKVVSDGVGGEVTARNSPSLYNSAFLPKVMFDGEIPTLEMQVIVPIQEHTEMNQEIPSLLERLKAIPYYDSMAHVAFDRPFDAWVLTRSISSFERTLISDNSPFDQYYYMKQKDAISESAKRGFKLFSQDLYCASCHELPFFTNFKVANNGLYKVYEDKGRFRINVDSSEIGFFKVPSLRNIMLTAPYMHDGQFASIDDVLDHYQKGGAGHELQSKHIQPFSLSEEEKTDLKAFLESLTDTSYLETFQYPILP